MTLVACPLEYMGISTVFNDIMVVTCLKHRSYFLKKTTHTNSKLFLLYTFDYL